MRDGRWRAEAEYTSPRDLPFDAPRPDYMRFADGPTRETAIAAVMNLCRTDKSWPLILKIGLEPPAGRCAEPPGTGCDRGKRGIMFEQLCSPGECVLRGRPA
jgi:hypothetical protein